MGINYSVVRTVLFTIGGFGGTLWVLHSADWYDKGPEGSPVSIAVGEPTHLPNYKYGMSDMGAETEVECVFLDDYTIICEIPKARAEPKPKPVIHMVKVKAVPYTGNTDWAVHDTRTADEALPIRSPIKQ